MDEQVREPFRKHVKYAETMFWSPRSKTEVKVPVYATIKWDGKRLSITGVEGPLKNGDCLGGCGQIGVDLERHIPLETVDHERFKEIWDRWHLNDMNPGTPRQMAWLRRKGHATYSEGGYEKDCQRLKEAGLYKDPETGYIYGTKWLHEDVPDDVLQYLRDLPSTTNMPIAWMR